MAEQLTHIDEQGDVRMVDVSQKADTERVAVAEGFIAMKPETLELITSGAAAKGDVLACARVAGVMAAKKTSELIPMCHPLNITKAKVSCEPVCEGQREDGLVGIHVTTTCGVTGKTGIEMEALTAASVACLTVYDMCKAVDRGMEIDGCASVEERRRENGTLGALAGARVNRPLRYRPSSRGYALRSAFSVFLNKGRARNASDFLAPLLAWAFWLTCGAGKTLCSSPFWSDPYTQKEPDRAPFALHAVS